MVSLLKVRALGGIGSLEDDVIPARADIYAAGQDLKGRIRAFGAEVGDYLSGSQGADQAEQAFLVAWNAFVNDFTEWDPDNSTWYIDRWGRRNEVLAFRKRFNDLQTWFRGLPGSVSSTPEYNPDELPDKSPWPVIARWGVYALIAGVAIYGAVNLFPALKGLGSALRLRRNPTRRQIRRRRNRRS